MMKNIAYPELEPFIHDLQQTYQLGETRYLDLQQIHAEIREILLPIFETPPEELFQEEFLGALSRHLTIPLMPVTAQPSLQSLRQALQEHLRQELVTFFLSPSFQLRSPFSETPSEAPAETP